VQIKQISKQGKTTTQIEELRIEIEMYKICVHRYVIRMFDYFEDKESIFLCLEKYSGPSLDQYIESNAAKILEQNVIEWARKIGQTLEHLHDNNVLLRNFQTDSIVMTDMTLKNACPKFNCFNKAEILGHETKSFGLEGKIEFKAPEVVRNEHYDFMADCWSFGIIIFNLLTNDFPYKKDRPIED
jgi:serine/threonine protein kinase